MTQADILSVLPAMSALNQWCRAPFEQQLDMSVATRSIYSYKLQIIREAFRLGMTELKPVLVPAKCKVCQGTGTYEWVDWHDEYHREYDDCRKCGATGNVVLHFIETSIGGYRWHSPLPHWDQRIYPLARDDWKSATTTDWVPGGEGRPLARFEFIGLVNQVERVIAGDKFIKYGSNGWRSLHLGDFTWKGCVFCSKIDLQDGRLPYAPEIRRPGFRWKQPECNRHHHQSARCERPLTWPHDLRPHWHRPEDPHSWYDHAPIPEEAYRPEVQEWLARRGIVIGLIPPEETAFTPQGVFVKVLAATPTKTWIRYYDSSREFDGLHVLVPSSELRARPVKLLEVRDALRLTAKDVFEILLRQYADKTNDFKISIGHHELPDKTKPIGMWNLPEFCGCISLTMQEICDIHERLVEDSIGE